MNFINSFINVFEMQYRRSSGYLVFFAIIQVMMSLGILIGFTYFMPENDAYSILFLATGAPTLILIMTGLVILPQQIGTGKAEGYHDFSRSWPVNRAVILIADTVMWILIVIPGIIISSAVAYFPMERLPQWLQQLHIFLPLHSMAEVMRASLASSTFSAGIGSYINLIIWCLLGYGGAIYILNKTE